jgi:hypothetical protein
VLVGADAERSGRGNAPVERGPRRGFEDSLGVDPGQAIAPGGFEAKFDTDTEALARAGD